jgi:SAM-dependent methyltransferase
MADLQALDQAQRDAWKRAAGAWGKWQAKFRELTAPVSQWMVDAIDPQPGQRVLELAAGAGETGFMAAERLGSTGTLISTDQSEEMLSVARLRADELGLRNVEFEVLDAQWIEFEPASVDAVLCRFGYMLMGDPDSALRGTQRALRPGGRLALAVWDSPERNLALAALPMQLVARGALPPPEPGTPSPFSMADAEALAQRLSDAGFSDIETAKVEFSQRYLSFDVYWEMTCDLAAPLLEAISSLEARQAAEVREAVQDFLGQFTATDGTISVPASTVVAAGAA